MKTKFSAYLVLIVAVTSVSIFGQKSSESFVPDELLVKFRGSVSNAVVQKANERMGSTMLERLGDLGWVRVKVADGMSVKQAMARYEELPDVVASQPNYYYHVLLTPNDPLFNPPNSMYGMTKISAPAAWDLSTGSSAVVVADIDTGMRYTHEDLAPNVWTNTGEVPGNGIDDDGNGFVDDVHGYDFYSNDADPADQNGHGTHTAGTIGAAGNNGLGVVGVSWNVKIMPIKIYSASGFDSTSAMVINAYNYVRMMRNRGVNIRVTNNSYGGCPETCGYDQATKDALDAMGEAGILNAFAAGNSGSNNDATPFYPASYTSPSIISVGGSDSNDNRIFNFGANSVDLAAPALGILSTTFDSDSSYNFKSGTSMATPHVAGAAALISSLNPALSAASLKATLINNVDQLAAFNGLNRSGGRLNVAHALQNQTVCTYNLSSNSVSVRTKGGYYSVNVTAPQNCDFAVKRNVNWIHLTSDVLSGNGTVTFRVTVNPTVTRSGTITVAGQTVTITQSRGSGSL